MCHIFYAYIYVFSASGGANRFKTRVCSIPPVMGNGDLSPLPQQACLPPPSITTPSPQTNNNNTVTADTVSSTTQKPTVPSMLISVAKSVQVLVFILTFRKIIL